MGGIVLRFACFTFDALQTAHSIHPPAMIVRPGAFCVPGNAFSCA
jgi:hypothetical protein